MGDEKELVTKAIAWLRKIEQDMVAASNATAPEAKRALKELAEARKSAKLAKDAGEKAGRMAGREADKVLNDGWQELERVEDLVREAKKSGRRRQVQVTPSGAPVAPGVGPGPLGAESEREMERALADRQHVINRLDEVEAALHEAEREATTEGEKLAIRRGLALVAEARSNVEASRLLTGNALAGAAERELGISVAGMSEIETAPFLTTPRKQRIALRNAAKRANARYLQELALGRESEALAAKAEAGKLTALIEETWPLSRMRIWLEDWKVIHPKMRYLAIAGQMGVDVFKRWPYYAGLITFALFIFEEVSQAFGFLLSFKVRGAKDKMSDPDLTSDAEYLAWLGERPDVRRGKAGSGVLGDLDKFELAAGSFAWWIKYPGIVANVYGLLNLAEPYQYYAESNFASIAETKRLLKEIETDRALAKSGQLTKATEERAKNAAFAVKEAFQIASDIGYNIGTAWNKGGVHQIDLMRTLLSQMTTRRDQAVALMGGKRGEGMYTDLERWPGALAISNMQRQAVDDTISFWEDIIARHVAGKFKETEEGEQAPVTPPATGEPATSEVDSRAKLLKLEEDLKGK